MLMTAGLKELPDNVKVIIADCAFTSPDEVFSHVLKKDYKLPKFPIMNINEAVCKRKAGYGFRDYSTIDAIHIIQTEQNKIFRHANHDSIELTMKRSKRWKLGPGASYESISLTYQPLTVQQDEFEIPDVKYKSMWYTNGVAAQPLYLTVMHRPEDNGLNFNSEYQKGAVTDYEMEYLYYYLCRILFRGIEDKNRTVGEILEMI